ncbi:MAG: hypothetical protein ACLGPL_03380 [Acidobacteriota bacterium]
MSVSSVTGGNSAVQQLWQSLASTSQASADSSTATQSTGSSTSLDLSRPGKLFSRLQQLSESDPDKFKSVMSDIADQLEDTAEASSDDEEGEMLKKAAERFRSASESGELSDAMPPRPEGPPPGPPPMGMSDGANGSQTNGYAQKQGQQGFETVLSIIGSVLDKAESA